MNRAVTFYLLHGCTRHGMECIRTQTAEWSMTYRGLR